MARSLTDHATPYADRISKAVDEAICIACFDPKTGKAEVRPKDICVSLVMLAAGYMAVHAAEGGGDDPKQIAKQVHDLFLVSLEGLTGMSTGRETEFAAVSREGRPLS